MVGTDIVWTRLLCTVAHEQVVAKKKLYKFYCPTDLSKNNLCKSFTPGETTKHKKWLFDERFILDATALKGKPDTNEDEEEKLEFF